MKDPHLSGYIASALVPHDANLGINEQEYVNHLKEISKAERLCGVYVNALVGQIYALEPEERQRLITLARQTGNLLETVKGRDEMRVAEPLLEIGRFRFRPAEYLAETRV